MNHICRTIYTDTQTEQFASELAKTQGTLSSQPAKTITAIAIATVLGLLSPHALAVGGAGAGSSGAAAGGAGGADVLSGVGGVGGDGVGGGSGGAGGGGGGGGAGTTGGTGGTGGTGAVGGAGAAAAGAAGAAGADAGGGGGGGAHGFVDAVLPTSAKSGGNGGNGGNGGYGGYGGGGGAGAYGAVITAAVSSGQVANTMTGGKGGNGGDGYWGVSVSGSGGHGLVLQHGGTLRISSSISGGVGGIGGIGGNGGDGIRVHTLGSSLDLTLQSGAIIQAGNGGAGGTAGTAGAAIRFNSGTNSLTLHDNVQIHGNVVATSGSNDTLNVRGKDISIGNIEGFEKLYFYVQSNTVANDILTTLTDTNDTNIQNTTIGVCVPTTVNSSLKVGDKLTLIKKAQKLLTDRTLTNTTADMAGCSSDYTFTLAKDGESVVATVTRAPKFTVSLPKPKPVPSLSTVALCVMALLLALMAGFGRRCRYF